MRIFVTGATGFVGGHLVQRLLKDQHQVHILTRPETKFDQLESCLDQVVVHTHSGSTQDLIDNVKKAKPDAVIHLASLFIAEHRSTDIDDLINSNVLLSTQLLESMAVNGIRLFINVGTSWQHYGDEAYNPVNLYAATKQAFRSLLRFYIESSELKVINLELFDTYGPNDRRGKLFSLLERLRLNDEQIGMSPGYQRVDLVHIDDVCDAFLISLERLRSGQVENIETYSVCSGDLTELRELVGIYEDEAGVKLNIKWGGRDYRSREVMFPWSGGAKLPGWAPQIKLREGINMLLQSYV
ncbi:MAG: NAD(P)-dependent oxidoreductase [Chloroflexota bacterium]|nr:NAD(P)-dependent oxidoreductase [Chloroflexota bacterium]